MNLVTTELMSGIAVVTIANPPVNALSHSVRLGLVDAIRETELDGRAKAVVLICSGRTFIAGADVREFDKPPQAPNLPDVLLCLENATKPWVAAIHGAALGGGLEVALACRYRIANTDARLGMPEVHLGLIPGAGGTVRLPRLVGPEAALDMIASGKLVNADHAQAIGLIDQIEKKDLVAEALEMAGQAAEKSDRAALISMSAKTPKDPDQWAEQKAAIVKKARGQRSPVVAIKAVENAFVLPALEALEKERDLFISLKRSDQSAALRQLFFAERAVAKVDRLKGVAPRPIDHIGVIGGGTMGAGIAAVCLLAGLQVKMIERDEDSVQAGLSRVGDIIENSHRRGLLSAQKQVDIEAAILGSTDYGALSEADIVIEAVFEDMAVKMDVFKNIQAVARANAVLATNTSYLDVAEIAEVLDDPSRLIGLHFFSPAHIMKLLEIVIPTRVASDVTATGFALAKRLKKIAVPAGVCDGFIANRMMSAYRREADYLIEDGCLPQDVDKAMVDFGFPMGVFAMQDMAGLDIGWAARKRQAATRPANVRYVEIADRICELGRLGRKTGQGWFDYSDTPAGKPDPIVERIIVEESARRSISRQKYTADQIIRRLLEAMQSEGQKILTEGIAASADAIDVVMANGYGFPRWRCGPMYMLAGKPS